MKERPILFSAPMVRAILDGRKTQTRRVMKPQPVGVAGRVWPAEDRWGWACAAARSMLDMREAPSGCPYGTPGDRLWVRETWRYAGHGAGPEVHYPADLDDYTRAEKGPWKPSIHMPRAASRLTLDVTAVRVEQLQEISELDALAEGVEGKRVEGVEGERVERVLNGVRGEYIVGTARDSYAALWDDINGDRAPWASNPWVWVIEFKRVTEGATAP